MPTLTDIFGSQSTTQPEDASPSNATVDLNGNPAPEDDGAFSLRTAEFGDGDEGGGAADGGVGGGPDFAMESPQSGGGDTFDMSAA